MFKIKSLDQLVHGLAKLPGIGPKSASRLAQKLLKTPQLSLEIREALAEVEASVRLCEECFSYTDLPEGPCSLCSNPLRSTKNLCVVEQPEDILQIEGSGSFSGHYHVLHGAISPLEGITPDRLKIKELLARIRTMKPDLEEVILAVDPDLEGDTTVLYLNQELESYDVKVTRLAQGIPLGSDIDYIDNRTLSRALSNRIEV